MRGRGLHAAFGAARRGAVAVVDAHEFIAKAGRCSVRQNAAPDLAAVVGFVAHGQKAGEQRAADKDAAVHFAVRALELQPAHGLRRAAAPAAHPGFLRHWNAVARVAGVAPGLGDELRGEVVLVGQQWRVI
jgi:hypothetical protein